ncbi:MAG: phosphoribosylanthranilate isomerase [Chthoniobacterales bacterium]
MIVPGAVCNGRPFVKICGLTNRADAEAAIAFGADALGFNFFPGSKRYLVFDQAVEWIADLPASILKVAVVVDPTLATAVRIGSSPYFDGLQLHGVETPAFCHALQIHGIPFAKAVPVRDETSLGGVPDYHTPMLVLDSAGEGVFGGSGKAFSWEWARDFARKRTELHIVLAGGLTPENVEKAVQMVRPVGVDVTSGVEVTPGRKDHQRMREFIAVAKAL